MQVVDAQGRVLAASPGGDRLVPLLEPQDVARARGRRRRRAARPTGSASTSRSAWSAWPQGRRGPGDGAGRPRRSATSTSGAAGGRHALIAVVRPCSCCCAAAAPVAGGRDAAARSRRCARGGGARSPRRRVAGHPAAARRGDEIRRLADTLNDDARPARAAAAPAARLRRRRRARAAQPAGLHADPARGGRGRPGRRRLDRDRPTGVLEDVARLARLVDDLLLLARLDDARAGGGPAPGRSTWRPWPTTWSTGRARGARRRPCGGPASRARPCRWAGDAPTTRGPSTCVDNAVRYARAGGRRGGDAGPGGPVLARRSPTTAPASRRRTASGCSSASPGSTTRRSRDAGG